MSAPTTLIIVRHGEAHCNRNQVIGGPAGCRGLTTEGRAQIRRLGGRLRDQYPGLDAIYTSPLPRAAESAWILAEATGLSTTTVEDLREQDHGAADGRTWTHAVRDFGSIPALEPDRPLAPGGETWRSYLQRVTTAIVRIVRRHPGQHTLIVGHGETSDAAFQHFLQLPADSRAHAAFALHNAAMSIWQRQPLAWTRPEAGQRWALLAHNISISPYQALTPHRCGTCTPPHPK